MSVCKKCGREISSYTGYSYEQQVNHFGICNGTGVEPKVVNAKDMPYNPDIPPFKGEAKGELTEAEREIIRVNIGVDGQDDTIYETVEKILQDHEALQRKELAGKIPKLADYLNDSFIDFKNNWNNGVYEQAPLLIQEFVQNTIAEIRRELGVGE